MVNSRGLVALYLAAIVAANLLVAQFGPALTVLNAFLFIGLNFTTRDSLHERWQGKHLWRNMAAIVGGGALLSAALNVNALPIAVASFAAFLCAGIADTVTYQALGSKQKLIKVNGSNLVSAAVDSVVFPLLAFGWPLLWPVAIGQFAAKVIGGAVWSVVLVRYWNSAGTVLVSYWRNMAVSKGD